MHNIHVHVGLIGPFAIVYLEADQHVNLRGCSRHHCLLRLLTTGVGPVGRGGWRRPALSDVPSIWAHLSLYPASYPPELTSLEQLTACSLPLYLSAGCLKATPSPRITSYLLSMPHFHRVASFKARWDLSSCFYRYTVWWSMCRGLGWGWRGLSRCTVVGVRQDSRDGRYICRQLSLLFMLVVKHVNMFVCAMWMYGAEKNRGKGTSIITVKITAKKEYGERLWYQWPGYRSTSHLGWLWSSRNSMLFTRVLFTGLWV